MKNYLSFFKIMPLQGTAKLKYADLSISIKNLCSFTVGFIGSYSEERERERERVVIVVVVRLCFFIT